MRNPLDMHDASRDPTPCDRERARSQPGKGDEELRIAARRLAFALLPALLCTCSFGAGPSADPPLYSRALADRPAFRQELEKSCDRLSAVDRVIQDAIAIGAPIYNAGSPLGCYRIYEGAAYKALYLLGGDCSKLGSVLATGLSRAGAGSSASSRAWTLRRTFDTILGVGTRTLGASL